MRTGYPELRSKVLAIVRAQLRGKGVSLDLADLEACYAQAWQGLYGVVLEGEEVESPTAWLVLVTFRRAIDETRSAARLALVADAPTSSPADVARPDRDLPAELDDRERLRQLFEGMRARLSARECEAASLCYLQGLSRAEAAARMGIGERRMRKLMEGPGGGVPGVAGKVGDLLATLRAGDWCEQQGSLMRAYALGLLDPDGERHALAVAHTRSCPACRAQVAALRGLASVLPPLPLLLPVLGRGGAGGSQARGGGSAVRGDGLPARAGVSAHAPASGAIPLVAKLALVGVVVLGVGSAYLAVRPSHAASGVSVQPAPVGGVARPGAAPAQSRSSLSSPPPRRAPRPRNRHQRRQARPSGAKVAPLTAAAADSVAGEFTPERVGTPAGSSRASQPAGGGPSTSASEFGIE